jgi:hypothetical protein
VRWLVLARGIVGIVARGACLAGCATLAGINDGAGDKPAEDAGAATDVDPSRDGATGPGDDAGTGPCAPGGNAAEGASSLHATRVETPVKVDGDGAEWACVDRLAFTAGQRVVGLSPGRGVADVAMQWDETHLYLWARVTTEPQPGTAPRLTNFNNDSFHLFVSSRNPTQTFSADDHHIAIDVLNQVADYAISTRTSLAGIDAKTGPRTAEGALSTFVVEAKIDAGIIGRTSFAVGDTVRVNFQINDQPDVANNYRVWFRDPAACVSVAGCDRAGGSEPFCDPRCTGTLLLR